MSITNTQMTEMLFNFISDKTLHLWQKYVKISIPLLYLKCRLLCGQEAGTCTQKPHISNTFTDSCWHIFSESGSGLHCRLLASAMTGRWLQACCVYWLVDNVLDIDVVPIDMYSNPGCVDTVHLAGVQLFIICESPANPGQTTKEAERGDNLNGKGGRGRRKK